MSSLDEVLDQPELFCGVDIGVNGAVAVLSTHGVLSVYDMPVRHVKIGKKKTRRVVDESALNVLIARIAPHVVGVAYEEIHAMPTDGRVGAFSFGRSCGVLHGMLAAHGLKGVAVLPQKWKAAFKLTADKNEVRAKAAKTFPDSAHLWALAKHHDRAEAAYLALYALVIAQRRKKA